MQWLLLAVGGVAYAVFLYNRLVALRNGVSNTFAQIDVQLQRRFRSLRV